ncbi:C-C motif chemokine 20-like [Phyllobates terribilis]|uniref:C-C motif chemokine 20-like n=1 Tax=Phyllobates terribilis TaxID=111132 RepID=UPI003CCB4127
MISSRNNMSVSLTLTLILVAASPVFGVYDCCMKHTAKKFKVPQVGMFERYYLQESSGVCDIDAVVFTVNSRPCGQPKIISLCADPKQSWVKKMMSAVDKQAKKPKKHQRKNLRKLCKNMKKNYA